jgi:hypothetical protein
MLFISFIDNEKTNIFRLMRLAEKLVNKSIYLQILSQTKSEEILRTYVNLFISIEIKLENIHYLIKLFIFLGF